LNIIRPGLLLFAFAAALGGCANPRGPVTIANIPPTVRLTQAPLDDGGAYFYAYRLNWIGNDPDGRIASYVYAIDPPSGGRAIPWTATTANERIIFFSAGRPDSADPLRRAIDFHTFAIRAVDDDGDSSEIVTRSFFSFTVAPTVGLLNPRPTALVVQQFAPSVRIQWFGTDPDGQFNAKPVRYKYTLLGPGAGFPLGAALADPDSLRRAYAPAFAGWDSVGGDTTEVQYTNLTPGATYLFAVVAFDEAGAYSPIFGLTSNMLRFRVGYAGLLGPQLTMFNEAFFYQYSSGGYSTDPSREVFIEVPAGNRVNFNWFATPSSGSDIVSYRWALDIADVDDNTPRSDEVLDVHRWSQPALTLQSAVVGPFAGGEEHRLYIEATDSNGLRSLGIVRFATVRGSLEKPLLIVDDTRFLGDQIGVGGCARVPVGAWPTAAELDTFLFARGGTPWRCYPAGTVSPPGLFAGYPFDTLGTRTGSNDATVRLARLGQYRHVVWIIDAGSATNSRVGSNPFDPVTSLRYMSSQGHFNSLGSYVQQGGRLWLTGGGGAFATMIPWDQSGNNGGGITFANLAGELVPGRFMYDIAGWRSEFKVVTAPLLITRYLGRGPTPPMSPPMSRLPAQMRGKNVALDPFPPGRVGQNLSVFYKSTFDAEFLTKPNLVWEDYDPDPEVVDLQSALDTLYQVVTFALPPTPERRVTMTYFHPPHQAPMMFTGFSIWDYTRADCAALVDFVLQDTWGLTRDAPPP
jgi:hypothetical protein